LNIQHIPLLQIRMLKTLVVCDDDSNPIGVNKPTWRLYDYNYNLHLMEER